MKVRRPKPPTEKPRRLHTRLAGLGLLLGSFFLLSPLAKDWYVLFMPVAWVGYVGIPLSLSIIAFPDWWDTHRD